MQGYEEVSIEQIPNGMFSQDGQWVKLFKSRSDCWLEDGSGGNKFKCSSERDREHIDDGRGKGRKKNKVFIIEPFGSEINMQMMSEF